MEGNTHTPSEVLMLLDGSTVEGGRLDERRQILALRDAFNLVAERALDGSFRLGKATSDAIDIPYSRMSEFDTALDRLFDTDDGTELMVFAADCAG